VGKVLIVLCMFAGRVGSLTLFIFFVGRSHAGRRYPLEPVQVG
jgi:Trk-type K+ transport system membrane component